MYAGLQFAINNIFVKLRAEPHFESDPNIAESGPNIVDVESRVSLREGTFFHSSFRLVVLHH